MDNSMGWPRLVACGLVLTACSYRPLSRPEPDAASDTALDVADDPRCFGSDLVRTCLVSAPTQPFTISQPTTIDTQSGSLVCAATDSSGAAYCVLAGTSIAIPATLRAAGTRPLVLIASDSITIASGGTVDVGSHRGATSEAGAGADPAGCPAGAPPPLPNTTSGGGAGGSFTGLGGNGGASGTG